MDAALVLTAREVVVALELAAGQRNRLDGNPDVARDPRRKARQKRPRTWHKRWRTEAIDAVTGQMAAEAHKQDDRRRHKEHGDRRRAVAFEEKEGWDVAWAVEEKVKPPHVVGRRDGGCDTNSLPRPQARALCPLASDMISEKVTPCENA
ncbi:Aste57867_12419 [Aphanomyces stellatus]|uniref:Aste57867_12419 protein n=1 Tax=Aphanomyces stellatus TaxID=120398 RepID=A0A485KVZ2_9STRA|nr:hypothetical protein As57867_012373 [Aphanomyces stellatus]VFT89270.1 Aste57867_12419 [Aphanomyces stellatus]